MHLHHDEGRTVVMRQVCGQVRLDEVSEDYNGRWLPCGALLVTPHPRLALPHTLYPCWEDALVFSNAVYNRGMLVSTYASSRLWWACSFFQDQP